MALIANFVAAADAQHPGINDSILQDYPILIEVPAAMANADTTTFTFPTVGGANLAPRTVQVVRHTGGDITNTVNDTWAVNNGDTIIFNIDVGGTNKTNAQGKSTIVQYTHSLSGVTNGAATAAQVAASINADVTLKKSVVAVASLTAQRVTLFSIVARSTLSVAGGTAQTVILFPGTAADHKNRTYQSQTVGIAGITGFSWSFNNATSVLTVTNSTGGAVNRVMIIIER